jgi:hypothetical protein
LPSLKLRQFNGDKEKWVEFLEDFKSAVDCRPIDDSEKLNYLRNFLEGQAYKIIEGLPLKASNYDVAIKLLKSHYGDEDEYVFLCIFGLPIFNYIFYLCPYKLHLLIKSPDTGTLICTHIKILIYYIELFAVVAFLQFEARRRHL